MGWVVRNGKSYITENISPLRDAENITSTFGTHYTGLFPSLISSKSMIGYDKNGKLMILQIDGVPSVENSGMTIFELADFAVELGFYSGINLISVLNMVQNGTTVSLNTENCINLNGTDGAQYYKCPGVHAGTYACIRSILTPSKKPISTPSSPHNSFQPTTSSSLPNSSPSSTSYKHPTRYPTRAHHPYTEPGSDSGNYPKPYYSKPSNNYINNDDFENGNKPDNNHNNNSGLHGLNGNATLLSSYQTLKTSMNFYKETSEILFLLLVVSVVMNIIILAKTRKENKNNQSLVLDGYGKVFNFIVCFLLIFSFSSFSSLSYFS